MLFHCQILYNTLLILTTLLTTVNAGMIPNACDMPGNFTKGATVRYFDYPNGNGDSLHDFDFF